MDSRCRHDLPASTCAVCTPPAPADPEFELEMGTNVTGWGYYDELSR